MFIKTFKYHSKIKQNHIKHFLDVINLLRVSLNENQFVFSFFLSFCQQFLYHLSQITPKRHPIRIKESKSDKKHNQINQNEFDRLCQQSLYEAVRNFQASTNASILELPLAEIIKQKPVALKRTTQTKSAIRNLDKFENTIRMSYVSKNSFRENKGESMQDVTPTTSHAQTRHATTSVSRPNHFLLASNIIQQLSQPIFQHTMQIRGFKTQRNIESQLKRNPTFLTRIQKSFGKNDNIFSIV